MKHTSLRLIFSSVVSFGLQAHHDGLDDDHSWIEGAPMMKKLFMMAYLTLGVSACGGVEMPEEGTEFDSARQSVIQRSCPPGYNHFGVRIVCAPRSWCDHGEYEEHVICRNPFTYEEVDVGRNGVSYGCCPVIS